MMRGLRACRDGVASLELALVTPVLIMFAVAMADCSVVYHKQLQLSAALQAGAEYAFTLGQSESGTTLTSAVTSFVQTISAVSLSSVTATYNGGLVAADYYCVTGSPPVFSGPFAAGAACTDGSGSTAGRYISITGNFTYTPMFKADDALFPHPISQTVMVRLQ